MNLVLGAVLLEFLEVFFILIPQKARSTFLIFHLQITFIILVILSHYYTHAHVVKPLWEGAQCWKETINLFTIAQQATQHHIKPFLPHKRFFFFFCFFTFIPILVAQHCSCSPDSRGILRPAMDIKTMAKLNDVMSLISYISQVLVILLDFGFFLLICVYVILRMPRLPFLAAQYKHLIMKQLKVFYLVYAYHLTQLSLCLKL